MLDFLRKYSREQLDSRRMDERRGFPVSLIPDLAHAGLLGLQVPKRYQGRELSHSDTAKVMRQAGAIDCNLLIYLAVHNTLGVPPVLQFAREDVRSAVLPELAQGRRLVTSAISEPSMGSHVRSITSTATKQPDGSYVLNGGKQWISLGADAHYVNVFARLTDENGQEAGITGFLVDTSSPGFVRGPEVITLGLKAVPQNSLAMENVHVPAEGLLGEEGKGLAAAKTAFTRGRLVLATGALGAAMRALELAQRFARRREVATGNLAENGRVQQIVAESVAAVQAVETLIEHITDRLDSGRDVPEPFYFAVKILGCELMWEVIDRCVQLLGARGFVDTNVVGQFYRDYRLFRIFEGTTEAITVYLGSMVLKQPQHFLSIFDDFDVDPKLAEHIARIDKLTTTTTTSAQQQHVLAAQIGELVCWSLLAVLAADSRNRSSMYAHTASWTEQQLLDKLRTAEDSRPFVELPTVDELARHIGDFDTSLGNVEQRRPGIQHDLDLLLRRG
ncbi:acyl-CoA dehydrogenase [Saccharopolyspora rhizosphaerae]|uniref:Acyl-CoA dehydrogenase n=2 Tax=Saccharopolyspora rhizosphaerae TaxID=2492662 RepID=A0A3R8Q3G8_9PSEU|nr:acyl-CoA dehydrogenase [Saccharopolyspora rhizosphaerae]